MSALEKLMADHLAAFRAAHHHALDQYARKAHSEIHAMVVARRRGLGQLFRHAARRVREALSGGKQ